MGFSSTQAPSQMQQLLQQPEDDQNATEPKLLEQQRQLTTNVRQQPAPSFHELKQREHPQHQDQELV
mgnify:CR=1 FL=1